MQELIKAIQDYKIADEICANEYETCSPLLRSLIKTAAAFHFALQNPLKKQEIFTDKDSSGFCTGIKKDSVPYAFFIVDNEYESPAKFLSVLCRAILSNVRHIFVFLDKNLSKPTFNAYINCMELCGIENSYYLPDETTLSALQIRFNEYFKAEGKTVLFTRKNSLFPKLGSKNVSKENSRFSILASPDQKNLLLLAYGKHNLFEFSEIPAQTPLLPTAREDFQHISKTGGTSYDISFLPHKPAKQNYGKGMEFCCICPISEDFFCSNILFANLESNYPQPLDQESE